MQCIPFSMWMSIRWTGASGRHLRVLLFFVAGGCHGDLQLLAGNGAERIVFPIEQHALAVFLEDGSINPAVSVEIGELCVTQMRVQVADVRQEIRIAPVTAGGRFVRVELGGSNVVFGRQLLLLHRIHQLAIGLVVPPHVPEVAVQHVRARVDVTDHALTGRHAEFKLVLDRVAGLIFANRRIDILDPFVPLGRRRSRIAVLGKKAARRRTSVVRVQHMTRAATTAAVVAGVVVGAKKVQRRVEQACLCQADEHRVGAILGTQTTVAKSFARTSGFFQNLRNTDFGAKSTAPFKDPQQVAGLSRLVGNQRLQERQDTFVAYFFRCRLRHSLQNLRSAVHAVRFAIPRILFAGATVVVKRRTPQHAAMRHHALAILQDFVRMALAAGDVCDA